MRVLKTRNGLPCFTPELPEEDLTPKFTLANLKLAHDYYIKNGYVVMQGLITNSQCNEFMANWNKEVKTHKGHIYRQATSRAEKNIFNNNGFVMNPILNLQSLNSAFFRGLRGSFESNILRNNNIARATSALIGGKPRIVQSMYFEGNSATWEHQDSYYLDDENTGMMTAAWIALEDIKADAGRFFVCPKSHSVDYSGMNISNNIAYNHERYISSIVKIIRDNDFEIRAPLLRKGDILFWNSLTIHGSLDTVDSNYSRSSVTFHAINSSSKLNVLRTTLRDLGPQGERTFDVYRPKDQDLTTNRLIFLIESRYPKLFYALKKAFITFIVSLKQMRSLKYRFF